MLNILVEMFYGRGSWFAEENAAYLDNRMDLHVDLTNPRKVPKTNGLFLAIGHVHRHFKRDVHRKMPWHVQHIKRFLLFQCNAITIPVPGNTITCT